MDIKARLRAHPYRLVSIRHEAAQEIERLEARVEHLEAHSAHGWAKADAFWAEIERLSRNLSIAVKALEKADYLLTGHAHASGKFWTRALKERHERGQQDVRVALAKIKEQQK